MRTAHCSIGSHFAAEEILKSICISFNRTWGCYAICIWYQSSSELENFWAAKICWNSVKRSTSQVCGPLTWGFRGLLLQQHFRIHSWKSHQFSCLLSCWHLYLPLTHKCLLYITGTLPMDDNRDENIFLPYLIVLWVYPHVSAKLQMRCGVHALRENKGSWSVDQLNV